MSTSIEWAQNPDGTEGETWNPTKGCDKVSPGCKHCYAETFAERWRGIPGHPYEKGFDFRLAPEHLDKPLHWKKPRGVFVNSMSDLFHKETPNEYIAAVFGVMAACPQHRFIILTKRAERLPEWFAWMQPHRPSDPQSIMHECVKRYMGYDNPRRPAVNEHRWPLPNVWLGVSVENQEQADLRIPHLLKVPAAVRFLSCEPLLEAVNLRPYLARPCIRCNGSASVPAQGGGKPCPRCFDVGQFIDPDQIAWCIVGGESGHGARPMRLKWARDLIEQCRSAGVAVFFKQAGEKPMISEKTWRSNFTSRLLNANARKDAPDGFVVLKVSGKGGEISELPGGPGAWPREFPKSAARSAPETESKS